MLRQRQLALKRQRDLAANSFGVMAQEHQAAPSMVKKGSGFAHFLVELDRPSSRVSGGFDQDYVKVVVGKPGSRELEGEREAPAQEQPQTPTALNMSLGSTIPLDCVQLDCAQAEEPEDMARPEGPKEPLGWVQADEAQKAQQQEQKEKPQRGGFWRFGRPAKRAAHFAEEVVEEDAGGAISAFDDEPEGLEEQSLDGPPVVASASRAQTPWPVQEVSGGGLNDAMTFPGAIPGAMDDDDSRRLASADSDKLN